MTITNTHTLVNAVNGNLAFKLFSFTDNSYFDHIQRLNYYSLIWIKEGTGKLRSDFSEYPLHHNVLLAFSPYQPFMLQTEGSFAGTALHFHPDFFCIHKHQDEVSCNGILFNNIYQPPFVKVDDKTIVSFTMLIEQIAQEMEQPELAQSEVLLSYLKIFLINASRLKQQQAATDVSHVPAKEPFVLQNLKQFIEVNYKTKHSAADYASLLHISPKALAKLTKSHYNKTITSLITERIVIEAKRELYLTNKTIKEIAWELGYEDEYYFSRFFKNNTDISPQLYRETVGFARGI